MVNQYKEGTVTLLVRLPETWKKRLNSVADELNKQQAGANYSATSIARQAIIDRVKELEQQLNIPDKNNL